MSTEPNEYIAYIQSLYGIQVSVHSPDIFPEMNNPIVAQPGYDFRVLITPTVLISDHKVCFLTICLVKIFNRNN